MVRHTCLGDWAILYRIGLGVKREKIVAVLEPSLRGLLVLGLPALIWQCGSLLFDIPGGNLPSNLALEQALFCCRAETGGMSFGDVGGDAIASFALCMATQAWAMPSVTLRLEIIDSPISPLR